MANASPRVQALAGMKSIGQQSSRVQELMSLTNEMSPGRPAQLSGIPVGQKVVQRELYVRKGFIAPEPAITEDYETWKQNETWHLLQQGLKMFTSAAGDILTDIEKLPNLVLTLSTSTEIDSMGKTTLKLVDPTGRVRTSEAGQNSSATIQEWSRWLGDPTTRVGVVVHINPDQIGNAAEVAHTLNHEVFLHAVEIFKEIKYLKSIKGDKERKEFAVQNIRNPDKDHEDFVFGQRKDLLAIHAKMLSQAGREDGGAGQLVADYKKDWSLRRQELLKELAGKLWDGSESKLKNHAVGVIAQWGSSSDPNAQDEVKVMRKIVDIINYDFDAHVAYVRSKYAIDLSPHIEEPERGKPVDVSALPTGPKKKEKNEEKKKGE
jgi:hypothetical protein